MTKRPSIIDTIALAPIPVASGGKVVETQAAPAVAAPKRKPRDDVQHTSVYLPRAVHNRLREIAFTQRCKVHDLIMLGVDHVLAEHGHTERATRSTTALQHDSATD